MVEEAEALARILAAARPLEIVEAPLSSALGMFLAKPIRAAMAHPAFDNSVVDGYAVRFADGQTHRIITGEQPAGRNRKLLVNPGEAVRIFTGAPIPFGCDAVAMQEDAQVEDGQLILSEPVDLGDNIRRAGADLAAGQLIGEPGDELTPQRIGLLASQGISAAPVHRRPVVSILSTGNELRPPGETLADGEIFDSNGVMLAALLQSIGISAEVRHCRDDAAQTEAEIRRAVAGSDVLIISGGVSVGDHDHVKPALRAAGIALDLWRIRMKPGKPLAFATSEGKLIFGLPGNPVAAFVTFLVLLRPALLQMVGATGPARFLPERSVTLATPISNPGDRPHYIRGTLAEDRFTATGLQESHALFGLSRSQALLRLEPGQQLSAGDAVSGLIW